MSDERKYDMNESDLVLQQLREHINGRLQGDDDKSTPDAFFEKNNDEVDAEEALTDDEMLLSEVLEGMENGAEPAVIDVTEEHADKDEAALTDLAGESESADIPASVDEAKANENEIAATVDAPEEKPSEQTMPPQPKSREKRRHAKKLPKLSEIKKTSEAVPMLDTALEEKKQRAADLAKEQGADLYWRATGEINERDAYKSIARAAKAEKIAPSKTNESAGDEVEKKPQKSGKEGTKVPFYARATKGEREEIANITVEGLLQDIFGKVSGPAGHTWVEPNAAEEEKNMEQTVEELVSSATQSVIMGEPAPEEEPPEREIDPNDVTLECDGQRIILPSDDERTGINKYTSENEERIKLFSAFSARRMSKDETEMPKPAIKSMSAKRRAFKQTLEESEEDFKLLVDLDYEDELGKVIGFEKIRDYHERRINGQLRLPRGARQNKRRLEYGSHTQDIDLCKYYAKQRKRAIIYFVVALFLLAFMFVYEYSTSLLALFGASDTSRYPIAYLLIGLLLFDVAIFLFRRPLLEGFFAICRLSVIDYSFASVIVLATVVYHVGLFFAPANSAMRLYLSPALFVIVLLAVSELINCYREFSAFRVISSKQQKYALLPRISVGGKEGNARLSLSERREGEEWYVRPVGFVRNYFTNTEKKSERSAYYGAHLLLALSLSLLASLFVFFRDSSLTGACHAAFVTFLLATPAISVFYVSVPMFFGTLLRLKRKGAIIGEMPVHETSDKTEVVLSELDCFKGLDYAQFELVKNCDAERCVILIRALLDAIDSPLSESVHVPQRMRLEPASVTLTDVGERGVAAVVRENDGNVPILLGDVSYLQKYGIRVSPKKDGRYDEIKRQMLCVAINGRLTALFVAQYRFKDDMEELLALLKEEGVGLVIRTKDPGIYDEMLKALVGDTYPMVRVMKAHADEMDIRTDRVDTSVVSLGTAKDTARTIAACRRIRRAVRGGGVWQTLSLLLGAGLAATLAFFGRLVLFSPLFVTLMALLSTVGHVLSAYLILRE